MAMILVIDGKVMEMVYDDNGASRLVPSRSNGMHTLERDRSVPATEMPVNSLQAGGPAAGAVRLG